ncbi:hypothetical protein EJ06DRAFT_298186 [Trichodelitschia bisporula]|uniref:Meiotically up-regulated protein Msb1/Mug8 domain-containing protein n=1 Tax=Trichodelitschia bisporula TaxID=703511 RepID=A0A6G1I736_9PEZI|nr:hypothetical protein EJ06DRAFT_298186 [Trichodelitschia bisporula]
MPFFSFLKRDPAGKSKKNTDTVQDVAPPKPRWEEAWSRKEVSPAEIQELIHECTQEMKSRALDMPFLLLPFRPGSDPIGSKNFIRHFFKEQYEGNRDIVRYLQQELRLMEPNVLCSIMKWCWSRLPGGIVTWETYELFRLGEIDSNMARNAFTVFIPISCESDARIKIVFDFFDLLAAIAARGKTNGLGGRKLSRMAGWWAFEHSDNGTGFDGGYRSWANAADATSHLFFAYLRSLSPESIGGVSGISQLSRSLQALLSQTEYPPETPSLMQSSTTKVVMIVDSVSPTPFALLRRAKNFEYRDDDVALQRFSSFDDPVQALTDECRRVLSCISSTNQSPGPVTSNSPVPDGSWSRFEDMGFSSISDTLATPGDLALSKSTNSLRNGPSSRIDDLGRPTTPSWADFLSTGFAADQANPTLLPPDKQLPSPFSAPRGHSSQSHVRPGHREEQLEPGELASVNRVDLDETFWWVWMTSLAGEETAERKAVFGRCALIETEIQGAHWLVIEEQVKGASPGQDEGVYIAEKKSRFSFTKRGRLNRRKTLHAKAAEKKAAEDLYSRSAAGTPASRIGPEQHAKIQAAAAKLARDQQDQKAGGEAQRRARIGDEQSTKTNSVLTLQPSVVAEAGPAMKWASSFDRDVVRAAYLGDKAAGTGRSRENLGGSTSALNVASPNGHSPRLPRDLSNRDLPSLPKEEATPVQKPVASPTRPVTPPQQTSAFGASLNPMQNGTNFDEKPPITTPDQHPALREAKSASPESPKRPNKENIPTAAGFKKFFNKKVPSPEQPHKLQKAPPRTVVEPAVKKFEAAPKAEPAPLKKVEPAVVERPAPVAERKFSAPKEPSPVRQPEPTRAPAPAPAPVPKPEPSVSRFNQGPLEDVPAFVPEDEPESPPTATPSPPLQPGNFASRAAALLNRQQPEPVRRKEVPVSASVQPKGPVYRPSVPQSASASSIPIISPKPIPPPAPVPAAVAQPTVDNASEEDDEAPVPAIQSDRWAQIRKNAAERAQRMNEEHAQNGGTRSRSQSGRTDDDETSGEETIESRVARIKARVAELTGNLDAKGNPIARP